MKRLLLLARVCWSVAIWLFVLTSFVDFTNLVDLLSPGLVLHDDCEILVPAGASEGHHPGAGEKTGARPVSAATREYSLLTLRVVLLVTDQDSPATPVYRIPISFELLTSLRDHSRTLPIDLSTSDLLFLRNRSLLI
jgi:hypothetical protein